MLKLFPSNILCSNSFLSSSVKIDGLPPPKLGFNPSNPYFSQFLAQLWTVGKDTSRVSAISESYLMMLEKFFKH